MRLVTRLTGLSADTIRAWERRHGAVRPSRSEGNTRRFSAHEVRRLVLLREATECGHSIKSIASLELEELERLVARREVPLEVVSSPRLSSSGVSFRELRQAYMGALRRFDTRRAFDLLMRGATVLDRRTFTLEVVLPTVSEVEARWAPRGLESAQGQMLMGHLRAVLTALLRLSPPPPRAPRMLFASVEPDRTEDVIIAAALLASAQGKDPVYLGPSLSPADIEWAVRMSCAHVLVLAVGELAEPGELERVAELIFRLRPSVQVWCGLPSGFHLTNFAEVDLFFSEMDRFHDALPGIY